MPADFEQALHFLAGADETSAKKLSGRIRDALDQNLILLQTPPFLTTGRMYRQLPDNLKTQLEQVDLAILKGDVNYRRLVGDRHWDPTTPVGRAAGHFPTSFFSLRSVKAELAVGLRQEQLAWMKTNAPENWMTTGQWGMSTFLRKR